MKLISTFWALLFLCIGCKKREEITPLPKPGPAQMRIVEIVDSNYNTARHYTYDDLGRVVTMQDSRFFLGTKKYEYSNGKLSRIVSEGDFSDRNYVLDIERDANGFITAFNWSYSEELWNFCKEQFVYDGQGNLLQKTTIEPYQGAGTGKNDTTVVNFSNFTADHRWQTAKQTVWNAFDQSRTETLLKRRFDSQNRMVFLADCQKGYYVEEGTTTLVYTDSSTEEYTYLEGTAYSLYESGRKEVLKDLYSPNLDIASLHPSINSQFYKNVWLPLELDFFVKNTKNYSSDGQVVYEVEVVPQSFEYFGLPLLLRKNVRYGNGSSEEIGFSVIRYQID